tara:strand:- start:194 stop:1705 length:1512 start_codon:yes stop_codon:yes gene_type:complete
MIKYYFIIFGIILYLLLNLHEKFEAVGNCNCKHDSGEIIYDRDTCTTSPFLGVGNRLDLSGDPCIYKEPLQYMHDSVMVNPSVCERGDTSLRCMVDYYDSVGGSCQTNSLFLYYLFIGSPLREQDIEWLNKFNFALSNILVYVHVTHYLLNRPIMRPTLNSLRLNPNKIDLVDLNKESLILHNLYQVSLQFKVLNTNLYESLNFGHMVLIYVSNVEESNSYMGGIFPNKPYDNKCIWFIDGCNRTFTHLPVTLDDINNDDLKLKTIWQFIKHEVYTADHDHLIQRNFENRFRNGLSDDFEVSVRIIQYGILNPDETITDLGDTGFVDKPCNQDDSCNQITRTPILPFRTLNCQTFRPNVQLDIDPTLNLAEQMAHAPQIEKRCVIQNSDFQYCSSNIPDDIAVTGIPCNNPNSACIVDNNYENSFYQNKLNMSIIDIESDIVKSYPKCLPTGGNHRPCNAGVCDNGLRCDYNIENDRFGRPKLPICIPVEPAQCSTNTTCNIM